MNKTIVFDMDQTLNRFYEVENWLEDLHASNPRPYIIAKPKYDMEDLAFVLNMLKESFNYRIVITTWLAKDSTKEYDDLVRVCKKDWLDRYNFPYDELHMVKYGTTKANCTRHHEGEQILFDDNEKIRKNWHLGKAYDANEDILPILYGILLEELSNL